MPASKQDITEILRQKITRGGKAIDFMCFCELLNECFFKKEINDEIEKKKKELEILQGSALLWSNDQKQEISKYIKKLKCQKKDENMDHILFWRAH